APSQPTMFFFTSTRRHTRSKRDWSSDVCSSDLRPDEVFLLEKQHLQPVSHLLSGESIHNYSITRVVNKDNTIIYKSNRYSVPIGTYKPKCYNTVFIDIKEETDGKNMLIVLADNGNEVLTKHELLFGKGQLIKNKNHQRDRFKGIEAFKEIVI